MNDKRRYERRPDALRMSVQPASGEARSYATRDVSDGGIFLFALTTEQLPLGTEVTIWPAHQATGNTLPTIKGRVVRSSAQGMGIEFIESSFS